uniref:PB1-like domain-containing protein n=1 Tax=Chenopodium quinoa TaxID=63459 RepID=A0A803MW93_CHEQI
METPRGRRQRRTKWNRILQVDMSTYFQKISLKVWHGGGFKTVANGELVYEGGRGRTKSVDPDELSYFELLELGKECYKGKGVEGLLYLIPGLSLCNGLRRINNDNDAVEVVDLGRKYRDVELYVLHDEEDPELDPQELVEQPTHFQPLLSTQASQSAPQSSKPQKSTSHHEPIKDLDFDWYDDRPNSLIPINDLIPDYSDNDDQDPPYDPRVDKGKGVVVGSSELGVGVFGEVFTNVDIEDEEEGDCEADQSNQHQTSDPQQPQQQTADPHHGVSSQLTQLGKGGRAIRGGRGSREGHSIAGRGQSHQTGPPRGVGVLFAEDGSVTTNVTRGAPTHRSRNSRGRTVSVNQSALNFLVMGTQPSQQSTMTQQPQ